PPRGSHDEPVKRVLDGRQRRELVELIEIEREKRQRSLLDETTHFGKPHHDPSKLLQQDHLGDYGRRHPGDGPAQIDVFERASRAWAKLSRFGQIPDQRVRIDDVVRKGFVLPSGSAGPIASYGPRRIPPRSAPSCRRIS